MADSIHDQWPAATDEWPRVSAQFLAAWISIFNAYNVNPDYAAFAAGIGYLSRMHEDTAVMAGDMITRIAQTGQDNTRGLIQNFQNLQRHVLPQWGAVAAAYADAGVRHEALDRVAQVDSVHKQVAGEIQAAVQADILQWSAAVAAESGARFAADENEAKARMAADALEAAQRGLGDQHSREQSAAGLLALSQQLTAQISSVLTYAQSLPGLVDQRAASGYDPTLRARGSLITRLLDTVTAHNPAIAGLVGDLARWAVDLAGVDDPVLKIAAQLVLKQVIDRLGLDTALQAMLSDLLGSIIGGGQPRTLQAVTADIGQRLDALEAAQASMSPLAPEADDLHEMGTLIFDAALLAYFTAAVLDPVTTAGDTVAVLDAVTGPLLEPVRALLGM